MNVWKVKKPQVNEKKNEKLPKMKMKKNKNREMKEPHLYNFMWKKP